MESTPSLASASDDESYALSTGPLTPNASPLFCPIDTGIVIEKRLTSLLTEITGRRPTLSAQAAVPDRQEHHGYVGELNRLPRVQREKLLTSIGGPTAAMIALHNPCIEVHVYDRDANRVKRWQSAHLPIHEPGLEDIVRIARDGAMSTRLDGTLDTTPTNRSPNLFFSAEAAESLGSADMVFLAVNTPTKTFGQGAGRATSMTAVDSAVRGLAQHVKDKVVLVEKSTVPCGTAQRISKLVGPCQAVFFYRTPC
jgi:UDPglucose 6-dehydrogenase